MITPQRQEILQLLERLSELTPDVRFGQLIANLSCLAVGPTNEAIWDMEDEQHIVAIRQHMADLSGRVERFSAPEELHVNSARLQSRIIR